jgi:hypothetical protein
MNCPSTKEIRDLKAKGTRLALRAAAQANSIRAHAFRNAYFIADIVDKRTGEIIDAYPMSKAFFDFVVRERRRKNETPEQKAARQAEEIRAEREKSAYEIKQALWS